MKIFPINYINSFKNTQKPKSDRLNITISEADTDGKWFYSSCSNPSLRICKDEFCPEEKQETIEYYRTMQGKNGQTEVVSTVTPIIAGKKFYISNDGKLDELWGVSYKKSNDELIQKTKYIKGYPIEITDYKDGEEYKITHYSQNTGRMNHIYYFDGSFELLQSSTPVNSIVELQSLDENGEKFALHFMAAKGNGIKGNAICSVPDDEEGHKTISLSWTYPNIKYSFNGDKEDAASLKNALLKLKKVLKDEKYREDFGSYHIVNNQLYDAIGYLSDLAHYS